ncbi:MAG: hypothetical protein QM586_03810 [Xenophilus sp.]
MTSTACATTAHGVGSTAGGSHRSAPTSDQISSASSGPAQRR